MAVNSANGGIIMGKQLGAGRNPLPKPDDLTQVFTLKKSDGLWYVVQYRLNKESRRYLEVWCGEGRDKSSALRELINKWL